MSIFRRCWNWCRRFRYRCGYGVHSPSDFFLITSVIYEESPYYAYRTLAKTAFPTSLPHYRTKVNRLLFRLVNYLSPHSLVEVGAGNGASMAYMKAAKSSLLASVVSGESSREVSDKLVEAIRRVGGVDMLHIGHTPYYKEVFEGALPYVKGHSCILVGNPYETKEKRDWWKQVTLDERVVLTFDLYDIGLVFFTPKRVKQNYIVNFL